MDQTVALVGFGTAAVNASIALRSSGYTGSIVAFSNTKIPPYSPMLTSYYAAGTKTYEECFPWSSEELAELQVQVIEAPVQSIRPATHAILAGGRPYHYTKALIASGAAPVANIPEALSETNPLFLHTMTDAERFSQALAQPESANILVCGSSMVALKMVEACLERGVSVTLLGRSEHILRKTAVQVAAEQMENALEAYGVDVRLGQTIEQIEQLSSGAHQVTFSNGDVMDFTQVAVAYGVRPNLSFVPQGALNVDQGVLVDSFMRTSDPDIYAAGDVAQVPCYMSESSALAQLWKEAAVQGACAGRAMAAELAGDPVPDTAQYPGFLPNNTNIVCHSVLITGGSTEEAPSRWVDYAWKGDCLVAGVYEQPADAGEPQLVGYSVFCDNADPSTSNAYDEGAYLQRRLRSF